MGTVADGRLRYIEFAMPNAAGRTSRNVSRSIEETRRPEMGEVGPLPSPYDLVSHHRTEKRRHRHTAMGDREGIAGSPRHRSDRGQMVTGDRPHGDAHRLRFDLADRRDIELRGEA